MLRPLALAGLLAVMTTAAPAALMIEVQRVSPTEALLTGSGTLDPLAIAGPFEGLRLNDILAPAICLGSPVSSSGDLALGGTGFSSATGCFFGPNLRLGFETSRNFSAGEALTGSLTVDLAGTTLEFAAGGTMGLVSIVADGVDLTVGSLSVLAEPEQPSRVPLPAPLWMLLAGIGALVLRRRAA